MSDNEYSSQAIKKDVLERAVAHLASLPPHLRDRYSAQLISDLANEVDRLRLKCWQCLRSSMAEQQFCKLPVAGSSPAVGSLTSEEREAILSAVWDCEQAGCVTDAKILLGIVERFGQTPVTKPLPKETSADVLTHLDGRIYVSGQAIVD